MTDWHVIWNESGYWNVRRTGDDEAECMFRDRARAFEEACHLARRDKVCMFLYGKEGKVEARNTYRPYVALPCEPKSPPQHVYPTGDSREHETHIGSYCWCNPTAANNVVVHNSADGRESYETGERLVN